MFFGHKPSASVFNKPWRILRSENPSELLQLPEANSEFTPGKMVLGRRFSFWRRPVSGGDCSQGAQDKMKTSKGIDITSRRWF